MIPAPRRAVASFALTDANGVTVKSGEGEALVGDDALVVGPVSVAYLDADALSASDYRIEVDAWPGLQLTLTELGQRFDTFVGELRHFRNRARVAGMLAHGITPPEVFEGAILSSEEQHLAEFQVYDTHVTIVPFDADPWQIPFGALVDVRAESDPPGIVLETSLGLTMIGQMGRRRAACEEAVVDRRDAQRRLLNELTRESCFADGRAVPRSRIRSFDRVVKHFTARERAETCATLIAESTGEPRFGFVQLLDPDSDRLETAVSIPPNWATFLLAPVGGLTVLEILAGPSAATYVFRASVDEVGADLQLLHLRRAPLALSEAQTALTPENPYRLALRRLEPLRQLRAAMVSRVIHTAGWRKALEWALIRSATDATGADTER